MKAYQFLILILGLSSMTYCTQKVTEIEDPRFHIKIVNVEKEHLEFYWKDDQGSIISDFNSLKLYTSKKGKQLTYAMNAGMYLKDQSPQGLYIENGTILKPLDTVQKAFGNFYLQPNGVFGISKGGIPIIQSSKSIEINNLKFATQSGPMLVIDGKIHPAFNKGSENTHIRNAAGILPNGNILLAISKEKINFYDFAQFFKTHGCENALYLDGFVSRICDPVNEIEQMDGTFGVIIGTTQ